MKVLVTGAAGFIGSHVAERLLAAGAPVRGVDCFTSFYPTERKRGHVAAMRRNPRFELLSVDLATADLAAVVADVDVVFHLAGQPGVSPSWANGFPSYLDSNVLATQRLLEAVAGSGLKRFVLASSSTVYGEFAGCAVNEDAPTRPVSPYGVSKLAAEHLCRIYAEQSGVPTLILRYFSVYGPRQRPDMALSRILTSAFSGQPFYMNGDGEQLRDFTYVSDVVSATLAAADAEVEPASAVNVAGGSRTTLNGLIRLVENLLERPIAVVCHRAGKGDVRGIGGKIDRARKLLNWTPATSLHEGVRAQAEWHVSSGL